MGWETQAQAPADTACTLIPKGSGRMDGASLAQMSWASGLHSGAAPQISATEGPQKAARFIGGLRELCMAWPLPPEFHVSQGADNPRKGLLPEPRTVQSALSSRLLLIPSSAQESPYWAPGFRSNVPLKGPDGTLCPWVCMTPDPAVLPVLLEATACPTPGGKGPNTPGPTWTGIPTRGEGQAFPAPAVAKTLSPAGSLWSCTWTWLSQPPSPLETQ